MNYFRSLSISLIFSALISPAMAMEASKVPPLLQPWIPWVLDEHAADSCPFFYHDFQQKHCNWPSPLTLELENNRGRFSGEWTLYQTGWIVLPGDTRYWPQAVSIDQKPAIVIAHQGKPALWLPAGHYQIKGEYRWDKLPEGLAIPAETGLIQLSLNGQAISHPHIEHGTLWLSSSLSKDMTDQQNSLDMQVFRQIIDDNPLQVITRLELNVSGKPREITLPHALLPEFIPIKLDSPLPARIEADGRLLMQIRAGRWSIELQARHPQSLNQLDLAVKDSAWPETELWAFQAMPALRLVEIDNLTAIDASQTNIPPAWRHLPVYQIKQGQNMHFKLIRTGDPEPEPNQLQLERTLWLDFTGNGYTVRDKISGKMTRDWRLNVAPEMQLGQVLLNGENQLITQLADQQGVEVRRGMLQIQADSRIQTDIGQLNAVGWQQAFRHAHAELNIPPGWRLLAVSGTDNEPDSWLTRWTLLDLFLVLIIALAMARLWSWSWGAVALFSLMLFWHEAGAPRWIWLHILAALALLRVLPDNPFSYWLKWYRNLCWLALIIIVVPFMVAQIRIGIYPQLEQPWQPIIMPTPAAPQVIRKENMALPMQAMDTAESLAPASTAPHSNMSKDLASGDNYYADAANFDRIDPEANLQTGPGLPQWHWQTVHLSWNGVVDNQQQIRLWYLSPVWTMLMHILQALLAALMTLKMLGALTNHWKLSLPHVSVWLLLPLWLMPTGNSFADFPDQTMLEQLKQKLLEPPECLPTCAQIPTMRIDIKPDAMRVELEIHAQQAVGVPLPAQSKQWFPEHITVDGSTANALIRQTDGMLWLALSAGVHTVLMQGRHALQDKFTLPLPLAPQYTQINSEGWRVDGLYENGKTGPQLEFNRLNIASNNQGQNFAQTNLPAFIRVERTLHLGLDWQITTRVVRLADSNEPIVLELPLLTGEAVIDADIRVKDGKVLVNMAADQYSLEWRSMLEKRDQLELKASHTTQWHELWRADVSPIWHLKTAGIAVVHHQDQQGSWMPEWRPWPGETVTLTISRPKAIPGPTLTIDKSQLKFQPNKRGLTADLTLDLRSSKGGQHTLRLPPQSILQNVSIDGISQPIRQEAEAVTLPIRPGSQQITLNWQMAKGQSTFMRTPSVDLGMASVNSHIQVLAPEDRWVLFTFGPKFGPAALIWGLLIVLALISLGLGRISLTPLQTWQWFLLLIGLSQIHITAGLIVIAWLLALGLRAQTICSDRVRFNLLQVTLILLSAIALLCLFGAVQQGLLGAPDMQISGNQSTATHLNWYQDHADAQLPSAIVISVPMLCYRVLMLCWSLWMAISLLDWLSWGWRCFTTGGLWKKKTVSTNLNDQPST